MDTIPQDIPQKQCTGLCGRTLPATSEYFYRQPRGLYGLQSKCKSCQKAYDTARMPIKVEQSRMLRLSDPAVADRRRKNERACNHRHAEAVSMRKKAYYAANPNQRRVEAHRRRTRERAMGEKYTSDDVEQQYKNQKGKCYYCKVKVGKVYDVDHVIPISKGGANDKSNIVIACQSCNRSKHDKLPHEWPQGGRLL